MIYPIAADSDLSLLDINEASLWKADYSEEVSSVLFFARDLFGHQYGVRGTSFYKLNLESGELELHSEGLEHWAEKILSDYDFETGWSLGKAWQIENHTRVAPHECLVPLRPFSIGGEFEVNNLVKLPLHIALRKYAELYRQVKDFIPGRSVSIVWNPQAILTTKGDE